MTNKKLTKVDVVIPAYNAEAFIEFAINSVLSQTHLPNAIIIVDDCSSDNTSVIVKSLQLKNKNIKLLKTNSNGGASVARNLGLRQVTSEFVAMLDADDVWAPKKLEAQIEIFNTSPFKENLALVYTNCADINADSLLNDSSSAFQLDSSVSGNVFKKLQYGNFVSGSCSSALVKMECLYEVGFFDESLEACEDWDLWLRLSSSFSFDFVNEVLVYIRRHDKNSQWNLPRMISGHLKFYSKIFTMGYLSFYRIMGFRSWIFRSFFHVNNFELLRLALNPYNTIKKIELRLEEHDCWNFELNHAFKKYFLSLNAFTILIWYITILSFFGAVKFKLYKFLKIIHKL
jgi:glycosyltransferase involved in cell wall biosynthesis